MGRLVDNPMMLLILLLVIVVLFGAPRLPGMARSLGQSLRIFRAEVQEPKRDLPTDSPTRSGTERW
ncbi:twin-arginine translocase TatA/TatE family subunit [Kocuria sp. NPDC057446]|uniref:twin-arginine translocase TatA/TatE family subunit n=1 Tax=Kocuria sp. NPDC057446 TaxID=3346137 RepID=UPI003698BA34